MNINQVQVLNDDLYGNRAEYRLGPSAEDIKWYAMVQKSCQYVDGHYEIALPFRDQNLKLPNNKSVAYKRLEQLKRQFQRQPDFFNEYSKQMTKLLDKGYAERAPDSLSDVEGRKWFLPHHGVQHPVKKGKLRVVFDCATRFNGTSLNDELLQGPDLRCTPSFPARTYCVHGSC